MTICADDAQLVQALTGIESIEDFDRRRPELEAMYASIESSRCSKELALASLSLFGRCAALDERISGLLPRGDSGRIYEDLLHHVETCEALYEVLSGFLQGDASHFASLLLIRAVNAGLDQLQGVPVRELLQAAAAGQRLPAAKAARRALARLPNAT